VIAQGWDHYASAWQPDATPVLPGGVVEYLGDVWTSGDAQGRGTEYGLTPDVLHAFGAYLEERLLDPYLPRPAHQGLEIGPGGGRLTKLLLPRTDVLHVLEASGAMLQHLRGRFDREPGLRYHLGDGMTLPALPPRSLDYVIAFDVFVHFEPRLVFWYLRQIVPLLKAGGTGIIHYANVLTPGGWRLFETDLAANVGGRRSFGSFGTMCPSLMVKFLEALSLEVVTPDAGLIPRDAVTVFRTRPTEHASQDDARIRAARPS
jgi:SAM-dependent methyltransferase